MAKNNLKERVDNVEIGKRFLILRRERGFSQHKLAKKAGISQSALSLIERNKRIPKIETIEKIAKSLDIPVNFFIKEKLLTNREKEKFIENNYYKMTDRQIAEELQISKKAVSSKIFRMYRQGKILPRKELLRRKRKEIREFIKNNYKIMKAKDIAKNFNVSLGTILGEIQRMQKRGELPLKVVRKEPVSQRKIIINIAQKLSIKYQGFNKVPEKVLKRYNLTTEKVINAVLSYFNFSFDDIPEKIFKKYKITKAGIIYNLGLQLGIKGIVKGPYFEVRKRK